MVTANAKSPTEHVPRAEPGQYTVVARRYRPQQFADLIGQEHVSAALVNALQADRVAHAYLFTGARGVGKTSAARILAKALNCVEGPTPTPCDRCDSCRAVATGDDVDVVEIDGASNNKVDEAREIRQNVGFRPARSRYKIYIIDEVHMLSTGAFNALLKTIEEPPPHVKFILATTEVGKIPVTILSRCQRFDFAHVGPGKIFEQLKRIVAREGYEADDDALKLVARRANGSMRDSQSLLDQLLASAGGRVTAEQVHAVLGTSGDERVTELAAAVLRHDAAAALDLLSGWADRGLQVGELVDQMVGYWRALMLVACGGPGVRELPVSPGQREAVAKQAQAAGLDAILAGLEVWTNTRARMRDTPHAQVLLEMAVVRLCRMGELLSVGQLVQTLGQGGAVDAPVRAATPENGAGVKKNGPVSRDRPEVSDGQAGRDSGLSEVVPLTEATRGEVWQRMLRFLGEKSPILAGNVKLAKSSAIFGPNSLAIAFSAEYNHARESCATEDNTRRLQDALARVTGQPALVRVESAGPAGDRAAGGGPPAAPRDRKGELMRLPLFRRAADQLGAQVWHVDDQFDPAAPPPRPAAGSDADPEES
jgi:DNA polymerase-3 subunit gamma/tau